MNSRAGLDAGELRRLVSMSESRLRRLTDASILVTGATGWFGVWLLDVLCMADDTLRLGIRITAVSRDPAGFAARFPDFARDPRIRWIKADVRKLGLDRGGFSHVIHAAADTQVNHDEHAQSQLFETIVDGTRRAIDAAGVDCKSFLFLSSGAVYGAAKPNCERFLEAGFGEPAPSSIGNAYAEGKRFAERICSIAASAGLPVRIARCFAFVGPHMPFNRHFAIGNFIADAVGGRPIRVKSDGRPLRSYLYMTDLIRALIAILLDGGIDRPYNVGSDISVTIEELAHCVDRVVGGCGVLVEGAASDPSDRYVPDTTRLRTELDFTQEVALDAAVARTATWHRACINGSMPI